MDFILQNRNKPRIQTPDLLRMNKFYPFNGLSLSLLGCRQSQQTSCTFLVHLLHGVLLVTFSEQAKL